MSCKEETICRLCLKVPENDFKIIDEITRKMLDEVLSLKVNLDATKDPIVCKDCTDTSTKCYDFKTTCSETEKLITSFAIARSGATFDLIDVYKHSNDINTVNDSSICQFCLNRSGGTNFVLSDTINDEVSLAETWRKPSPAKGFVTKNPVICTTCRRNSERYVKFQANCLCVEEKIIKYRRDVGVPCSARVILSDVLFKNTTEVGFIETHGIKREKDIDDTYSGAYNGELIKTEEMDIKDEDVNSNETDRETPSDVDVCPEAQIFKCLICTFQTTRKYSLKNHALIHKHITEVMKVYKCSNCPFQTKRKSDLKRHMLTHENVAEEDMYKCPECVYKTNRKNNLKSHMVIHKDIREVKIYTCATCNFNTKHKHSFERHLSKHKDVKEVRMYSCPTCAFQTRLKSSLVKHIKLLHKDVNEVEMYKCPICIYETKLKCSLKRHTLTHKHITEVRTYKCSVCERELKHKQNLRKHMLMHNKD